MYFNFGVADCVLLAFGRNYSTNFVSHSFAWQIFAVHYDLSIAVGLDNCLRSEHSLQVTQTSLFQFKMVLNVNSFRRSPSTHNMSPAVRKLFLGFLPKLMMMRRTKYIMPDYDDNAPNHGYINEMDVR